jgi:hypothetical protein
MIIQGGALGLLHAAERRLFRLDRSRFRDARKAARDPQFNPRELPTIEGAQERHVRERFKERRRTEAEASRAEQASLPLAAITHRSSARTRRSPAPRTYRSAGRGSFVVHDDSTWQALTDTAKRPGTGEDWVLIARAGKDGRDGQSPLHARV